MVEPSLAWAEAAASGRALGAEGPGLSITQPENLVLGAGEKVTLEDQRWRVKRKGLGMGEREEEWGRLRREGGKGTKDF